MFCNFGHSLQLLISLFNWVLLYFINGIAEGFSVALKLRNTVYGRGKCRNFLSFSTACFKMELTVVLVSLFIIDLLSTNK